MMANARNDDDPVDEDGPDGDEDVGPAGSRSRPRTARAGTGAGQRRASSSRQGAGESSRPASTVRAGGSERTTKWAIDRLDGRERRFCFSAAAAAAVFGVVVYVIESSPHFHRVKGQLSPQTVLTVGLVGGALLFGATLLGRRAPVGFVALFLGLLFSNSTLFLALPFLVLAIWILYRSYKIQREATAEARAARTESATARARPDRLSGGAKRSGVASTKGRKSGPARPEANKRFTPKRPPPPAPKPSRRQRKAASTPD